MGVPEIQKPQALLLCKVCGFWITVKLGLITFCAHPCKSGRLKLSELYEHERQHQVHE